MELHYKHSVFSVMADGNALLMITIPSEQKALYDKIQGFEDDKPKVVTIEYYKEKRTLTANNYLFVLLGKIAKKMNLSVGDCYVKMIKDYGVSVGMFIMKEAYPVFESSYNKTATSLDHKTSLCVITKEYMKGFTEWVEFQAYLGSSGYDKKQFSHLVDGVVQEAADLGIETMPSEELKNLIERYTE